MSQALPEGPFRLDGVEHAPSRPGLYAWYARLSLGQADWDETITEDAAEADRLFIKGVEGYSRKHQESPLSVEARGRFSSRWLGILTPGPNSPNSDTECPPATHSDLPKTNSERAAWLELIAASFPVFSSPLYIGMTVDQNLRNRLGQHQRSFYKHWESARRDPLYRDRMSVKDFGSRAVKAGFAPTELVVYTLCMDGSVPLEPSSLFEIIESAEWRLNRWAHPVLGRD